MTQKTISVTVPVTLRVDIDDLNVVDLDAIGKTLVKFMSQSYLQELIAEQLFENINDAHPHRHLIVEGTDVKADTSTAKHTITLQK